MFTDFYFDFISPYSYFASALLERHGAIVSEGVRIRPVVFGTMLSKLQKKGPGEIPERRRMGVEDGILLSQFHGIPFVGPPAHPFNSLYALRSVLAVEDPSTQLALTVRYFQAAWAQGCRLDDIEVLKACLADLGISQDPEAVASDRTYRAALKKNTAELLALGGYGVPTFVRDGLMFFGHDRLALLEAVVTGQIAPDPSRAQEMLARPQPGRAEG